MKKMDLICFDLDNTLVYSDKVHVKSYNLAFEKNGFRKRKFEQIATLFGRPHDEVIKRLTGVKNKKVIEKIYDDHNLALQKIFYKEVKLIPGVKETLRFLNKRYELGIVSNTTHKNILFLLRGAGLDKNYFHVIIGNDDVKNSKPYPDEILKAERMVRHKAKYIIGDSVYDILAGRRANIKTIGVLSGSYSARQLKDADYIIKDIRKLKRIL